MENKYQLLNFIITKIIAVNENCESLVREGKYKEAEIVNANVSVLLDLYDDIKKYLERTN